MIGEAGAQGLVPFITDNVLPGSFVQPFVENEILRIRVLGVITAAAISFLADKERMKVVGVFEVIGRIVFGVIRIALVLGIDRIMSEGRALTNCIGNGVATMVVAKWQGERDDERFQAALRDPRFVEEATERALRGEDIDADGRFGGRFQRDGDRDRAGDLVLPGGAGGRQRGRF